MSKYKRTIEELRKSAILHWPDSILNQANDISTLPLLIKTQDNFISILKSASKNPHSWKIAIDNSKELSGSLFLKHLMVLSDLGGEALNKLPPLNQYISNSEMNFEMNNELHSYKFKEIGEKCTLTNNALNVDGKNLTNGFDLNARGYDVCMLLLFGSQTINATLPTEIDEKCIIGGLLGKATDIDTFVKQRYLHVSRQTGGAKAASLGNISQKYVSDLLRKYLQDNWSVIPESSIPGVFHSKDRNETKFDIVLISPKDQYFGIEVSFQVTTNSTIERKARESASNMQSVHKTGNKICYVIDGAGNINIREKAVSTLCEHSDCTVTMSEPEIKHLADYCISIYNGITN